MVVVRHTNLGRLHKRVGNDDDATLGNGHRVRTQRVELDVLRLPHLRQTGDGLVHATAHRTDVQLALARRLSQFDARELCAATTQQGTHLST